MTPPASPSSEAWVEIRTADEPGKYYPLWLALQCGMMPTAIQGLLVLSQQGEKGLAYMPVAEWPRAGAHPERLHELCERVLAERSPLLVELPERKGSAAAGATLYGLGYPLIIDTDLLGLVAVEVADDDFDHVREAMQQLQWGAQGLEAFLRRQQVAAEKATAHRLQVAVDLLAVVLGESNARAATLAFVSALADRLACDRASLGLVKASRVTVAALSHTATFSSRSNLVRSIQRAMDESLIERQPVRVPLAASSPTMITRCHEDLSRVAGEESILSVPIFEKDRYIAVVTLERPINRPFTDRDVELVKSVLALAFPILETRRRESRWLITKLLDSALEAGATVVGAKHLAVKLVILLIGALIWFLAVTPGQYRITSDTVLEGSVRRVVAAPFPGFIQDAMVRAGDEVKSGSTVATLDDRDLRLERLSLAGQRSQVQRQLQEAFAKNEKAKVNILSAQLEQLGAQLDLIENKLGRITLKAPFDGLIIAGDLSQRLGASVQQGEVLFEIAPLANYRVILKVDERKIKDVQIGQKGHLILSALPEEDFHFQIEKLTPINTASEGRNFFRVEAKLENPTPRLRPGMEGVGKIQVDHRKLLYIYTHDIVDAARLLWWEWVP